ncbi:TPA: hypothetical protein LTW74_001415 [Enterobacter hormaechei]|nr:hypothetical protein [Enterobacter hormaechei]
MDELRKQRDEFEKWWEDEGWDKKLLNVQGVMFNRIKAGMFTAWQASRAAIEVELPEWFSPHDCGDRVMWSDAVEKAIRAAGIKVKE